MNIQLDSEGRLRHLLTLDGLPRATLEGLLDRAGQLASVWGVTTTLSTPSRVNRFSLVGNQVISTPLSNHLLVALPSLHDPHFARSVTLVCQHDADGAMGVMVNRASEYTLGEVLQQMGIASDSDALQSQIVLAGGPVHPERGFVLHDGDREWDSSLAVGGGLYLTTSRDVLEAMARDNLRRVTEA